MKNRKSFIPKEIFFSHITNIDPKDGTSSEGFDSEYNICSSLIEMETKESKELRRPFTMTIKMACPNTIFILMPQNASRSL